MKLKSCLLVLAACASIALPADAAASNELSIVKTAIDQYQDAFNKRDASRIATMWTPTGTFIDAAGHVYYGRDQIEQMFAQNFTSDPKIDVRVENYHAELIKPDTIVERGYTVVRRNNTAMSRAPYLAIHKRIGTKWLLEQVVEYPPFRIAQKTPDLKWMLGKWSSTNGAQTVTLNNTLTSDGKFILSQFDAAGGKNADVMITGINPMDGRMASWIYDNAGGVGRGEWRYNDGAWYLRSARMEPNGDRVLLTHVIKRDGDNAFDWQTLNRVVNGKALNDTETIRVIRMSEATK